MMDKAELIRVITEMNNPNTEVDPATVMDAYHSLDDLNEPYLGELIDDYILRKLDVNRTKMFEDHMESCERCKKELAITRVFVKAVKDLGDEIL